MLAQTGVNILNRQNQLPAASSGSDDEFLKRSRSALDLLENVRLKKLKIYETRKRLAIPAALVLGPACMFVDYLLLFTRHFSSDNDAAGLTFLVMGALYAWVTQPKRDYAKAYKNEILPRIAALFGNFTYAANGKIDMARMNPSQIVPHHNRYSSEDYFTGEYKGVRMEFSEMELEIRSGSGKNRRTVTVFKGLAILLDTNHKRFFGHTIIDENRTAIGQWFKQKTSKLERADMVDPEFEKVFDAWTNDQVEARYLIDPLMIERLTALYAEYKGDKMAAAFYENKMLIMIASKHNHFEPPNIYVPAADPQGILNMKREVGEILSIIDKLSLYDPKAVHELRQSAAG